MVPIHRIMGRLGNQMFEAAALYAYTRDNAYPFFVQDEKYFKVYEDDIRLLFGGGIISCGVDRASIHVRRTDYVNNPFYIDLSNYQRADMSDNYYVRAMAMFPSEKFLVFSDNIGWCKNSPLFDGCEFSEGQDEVGDMNLMASCKHNIIANSSFSWWAAWLNPNPDKIVVAPKQWFSDPNNEKLIGIPKTWRRI
jgi:Glycosyl transferase family 11